MHLITTPSGTYLDVGQTVEVWLAGTPLWQGRLVSLRPGHDRPYVVDLEADISACPTSGHPLGRRMAFHRQQVRPLGLNDAW